MEFAACSYDCQTLAGRVYLVWRGGGGGGKAGDHGGRSLAPSLGNRQWHGDYITTGMYKQVSLTSAFSRRQVLAHAEKRVNVKHELMSASLTQLGNVKNVIGIRT